MNKKTTIRDNHAIKPQFVKLICIHNPTPEGCRKARKVRNERKPAVVQKHELPSGPEIREIETSGPNTSGSEPI